MSKSIQDYLDNVYEKERLEDTKKKFINECGCGAKGPIIVKVEEVEESKTCPDGYRWCPISKKCIPDKPEDVKGKGRRTGRGGGKGPMGKPFKEGEKVEEQGYVQTALAKLQPVLSKAATVAGHLGMGKDFAGDVARGIGTIQSGRLSRPWGMPEDMHKQIVAGESKVIEQETPPEKANELQPVPEGDIDELINDLKDEVTEGVWDTVKKVGKVALPVAAGAALGAGLGTGAIQQAMPAVSQAAKDVGTAVSGAAGHVADVAKGAYHTAAPAVKQAAGTVASKIPGTSGYKASRSGVGGAM